jgi:hypothetical protein
MKRSNKDYTSSKHLAFILIIATAVTVTYSITLLNFYAINNQQKNLKNTLNQPSPISIDETKNCLDAPSNDTEITIYKNVISLLINASTTSDGKKILSRKEINDSFVHNITNPQLLATEEEWNSNSNYTEWIPYQNDEYDLNMEIPYNSNWGSEHIAITPFDSWSEQEYIWQDYSQLILQFGPVEYYRCGEGCGWGHSFTLSSAPKRTYIDIEEESLGEPATTTEMQIGDKVIIKTTQTSDFGGTYTIYEILGNQHNYTLGFDDEIMASYFPDINENSILEIIRRMKID